MKVNFNNVRKRALIRFNELTEKLNDSIRIMIELELITITNGVFTSRKTTNYDDTTKAEKAFSATVSKFTREDVRGLVTLRELKGKFWVLSKIVKV